MTFPSFDACLPTLNEFIHSLVKGYESGNINSWEDLEDQVRGYFTPQRMEQMELIVPGWQKMASYTDGITLVHVMCVFLGLFMLPEFRSLMPEQKQLAKWIVLFHDLAKAHTRGQRDTMHAFRSGVQAAQMLAELGFPTTGRYRELINSWSEFVLQASVDGEESNAVRPDNQKLPGILSGIDQLYGEATPATLIIKTVLLHISLDVDPNYPTPAPLTEDEIKGFIDSSLFPLLKVMMLADNEGWSLFDPETRAQQRADTLQAFQRIEKIIFS